MERVPFLSDSPEYSATVQFVRLNEDPSIGTCRNKEYLFDLDVFNSRNVHSIPEGYCFDLVDLQRTTQKLNVTLNSDGTSISAIATEDIINDFDYRELAYGQGYDLERGISLFAINIKVDPEQQDQAKFSSIEDRKKKIVDQFTRSLTHLTRPHDFADTISKIIFGVLNKYRNASDISNFELKIIYDALKTAREEYPLYVFGRYQFPDIQLARLQRDIVELTAKKLGYRYDSLADTIEIVSWVACKIFLIDAFGSTEVNGRKPNVLLFSHPSLEENPNCCFLMIDTACVFGNIMLQTHLKSLYADEIEDTLRSFESLRSLTKISHRSIARRLAISFNRSTAGNLFKMSFASSDKMKFYISPVPRHQEVERKNPYQFNSGGRGNEEDEIGDYDTEGLTEKYSIGKEFQEDAHVTKTFDLFGSFIPFEDLGFPICTCWYTTNSLRCRDNEMDNKNYTYYNYCLGPEDINDCGIVLWSSILSNYDSFDGIAGKVLPFVCRNQDMSPTQIEENEEVFNRIEKDSLWEIKVNDDKDVHCLHMQIGTNALNNDSNLIMTHEEQSTIFWEPFVWTDRKHAATVPIRLRNMEVAAIDPVGLYNEDFSRALEVISSKIITENFKNLKEAEIQSNTHANYIGGYYGSSSLIDTTVRISSLDKIVLPNPLLQHDRYTDLKLEDSSDDDDDGGNRGNDYIYRSDDEDGDDRDSEEDEQERKKRKKKSEKDHDISTFSNFYYPLMAHCRIDNSPSDKDGIYVSPTLTRVLAENCFMLTYSNVDDDDGVVDKKEIRPKKTGLSLLNSTTKNVKIFHLRHYTYNSNEFNNWIAQYVAFIPWGYFVEPPSTSSLYNIQRSLFSGVFDNIRDKLVSVEKKRKQEEEDKDKDKKKEEEEEEEIVQTILEDYSKLKDLVPKLNVQSLEFGLAKGGMTLIMNRSLVDQIFTNADLVYNKIERVNAMSHGGEMTDHNHYNRFFKNFMKDLMIYYGFVIDNSDYSRSYKYLTQQYHEDTHATGNDQFLLFITKSLELEITNFCMTLRPVTFKRCNNGIFAL